MYIVAIAWIYVVFMMSITEESVVAGLMTLVLYGILPLTIVLYIMGTPQRKRRRAALAVANVQATASAAASDDEPASPEEHDNNLGDTAVDNGASTGRRTDGNPTKHPSTTLHEPMQDANALPKTLPISSAGSDLDRPSSRP